MVQKAPFFLVLEPNQFHPRGLGLDLKKATKTYSLQTMKNIPQDTNRFLEWKANTKKLFLAGNILKIFLNDPLVAN